LTHLVIDLCKESVLRLLAPKNESGKPVAVWKFWSLVVDQAAYLAAIVLLLWFMRQMGRLPQETFWSLLIGEALLRKMLVVWIGVVVTVYVGGVLIGILVEPFLVELKGMTGNAIKPERRGLENGGKRIGQIERALILLFILSAQPASVGFLVTAKSVFRFGELKNAEDRKEAEYIIIGTMLSFTWAIALSWAIQYALQVI
jgi:hypothetical protein